MSDVSLVSALSNRMEFLSARQGVVTSNVANANTPGYIAKDMTFNKLTEPSDLKGAPGKGESGQLTNTHTKHMQGKGGVLSGNLFEDDTHIRHDGNSVKLDEEMLKLNEIQLNYGSVVQLYQKQKQMQQMAVRSTN